MAINAGVRLGPYEILEPLGAGGMGEVYRARDTRLERTVAIKMLPAHVADDPVRRERFEGEARAIATLTHPHVCTLYDVGHQDGIDFLVLEHLEGETLEARLRSGPLPLPQALRFGIELADALDQAHQRGIVHRDLKPTNIFITRGTVKVLDFGLSMLREREAHSFQGAAPGGTTSLTAEGTIIGTVQYMAPEQIEGRESDGRTDLFALGAVLYEMVTGERAFKGESPASQMAAVLNVEPPPASVVRHDAAVLPAVDHVIERCLAKDPEERWQSARDIMLELGWIASTRYTSDSNKVVPQSRWARRWVWSITGLVSALGIGFAVGRAARPDRATEPSAELVHFSITAPDGGALSPSAYLMALSPDGRRLAFVASLPEGPPFLWIRSLDSTTAYALAGTERATTPFWSPDSRSVAFVAGNSLKRIDVESERVMVLSSDAAAFPGAWSREGIILFYRGADRIHGHIDKVSAQGGPVTPATTLDQTRREVAHSQPTFLPDGHHFVFVAWSNAPTLCLASVGSPGRIRTMPVETFDTRYVEPGYLVWHRGGTLLAQPFDPLTFSLRGRPSPIARQVRYHMGTDFSVFSMSHTGVLAYRGVPLTRLAWVDRRGTPMGFIGQPASYSDPVLSPDGKHLAVCQLDPDAGTRDIWLCDIDRGVWSRLSFNPADETRPVWSFDGKRILFASNRNGYFDLFTRSIDEGAGDVQIEGTPPHKWPIDWSRDDRFILYIDGMSRGMWMLPSGATPRKAPRAIADTSPGDKLSPDSRWLAFTANRSSDAAPDIFVADFPAGNHTWRISSAGGIQPKWRSDGKELFYLAADGRLMAVSIDTSRGFEAGQPHPLFQTTLSFPVNSSPESRKQYDVAPNGQRFLLNQPVGDTPITIVLNWTAQLPR